jgi:hypothetical protein
LPDLYQELEDLNFYLGPLSKSTSMLIVEVLKELVLLRPGQSNGGESGIGARPMQESWVKDIHRICRRARVAFFFKQWGGVRKATTGRLLNGRTYDEMPKLEAHSMPTRHARVSAASAWDRKIGPSQQRKKIVFLQPALAV